MDTHYDVAIIGGGPAGSTAASLLSKEGIRTAVVEKKTFPREVLCGEFLSQEVVSAIKELGVYDEFLALHPNPVSHFRLHPENGTSISHSLGFEAYALKRSTLDLFLLQTAERIGATVVQPAEVLSINRRGDLSDVLCKTSEGEMAMEAHHVIAAYGKQNILDKRLKRNFTQHRSGYTGIKYHLPASLLSNPPGREIQLFTAEGIYCGVNMVSDTEATLCFLFDGNKHNFDPNTAFSFLLERNGTFQSIFKGNPQVSLRTAQLYGTGNIYFGQRNVIENGVLMIGDAAAVIAPLAGDGIGMAMESGRLAAHIIIKSIHEHWNRAATEQLYRMKWSRLFKKRLSLSLRLQHAALHPIGGTLGMRLLQLFPWLTGTLIRQTRKI